MNYSSKEKSYSHKLDGEKVEDRIKRVFMPRSSNQQNKQKNKLMRSKTDNGTTKFGIVDEFNSSSSPFPLRKLSKANTCS